VQTFGINATKRSGTLRGSCGENSIPDFGRPIVFDAKLSEFERMHPISTALSVLVERRRYDLKDVLKIG
jgi:hypothetical protein